MATHPYSASALAGLRALSETHDPDSVVRRLLATVDEARAERDALREAGRELLRKAHVRCDDCGNFAHLDGGARGAYCYPVRGA